jgi:propanol-preferring alcohol dehydrogenase
MNAMVLARAGAGTLERHQRAVPAPAATEVLVRVHACAVCRTDLHVVDGELPETRIPIVPGHQIVGIVERVGDAVTDVTIGDRVGVPWLGWSCGRCEYCSSGRENLCADARYTGCQIDGGFAEYASADARFVLRLPDEYSDTEAAPLLCAGLIGYRAYRLAGDARRLGLYGFGAAAHILAQVARHEGRDVFAFTSPGDQAAQEFARRLGARWAGASTEAPPEPLDAAIIFAPVGRLVPEALSHTAPGGTVVCAGIHMSDLPSFPYRLLWQERVVRSVANLTRQDGRLFLKLASTLHINVHVQEYNLSQANRALGDLRTGHVQGTAVLVTDR